MCKSFGGESFCGWRYCPKCQSILSTVGRWLMGSHSIYRLGQFVRPSSRILGLIVRRKRGCLWLHCIGCLCRNWGGGGDQFSQDCSRRREASRGRKIPQGLSDRLIRSCHCMELNSSSGENLGEFRRRKSGFLIKNSFFFNSVCRVWRPYLAALHSLLKIALD